MDERPIGLEFDIGTIGTVDSAATVNVIIARGSSGGDRASTELRRGVIEAQADVRA